MDIDTQSRSPDLNSVPEHLIRYTNGNNDLNEYMLGGFEVFTMFNLAAQRYAGKSLRQFAKVLDFGCGAGRVIQYIPNGPDLHACDVNGELVKFVAKTFPSVDVHQNNFTPPLKYADDSFDLVYAFSVFSHLTLENEQAWLDELRRIGRDDCLYLVTVQGDWMIEKTLGAVRRAAAEAAGFYYRSVHERFGSSMDFPVGYESSYHTSSYIKEHWTDFEVLAIIKGDDPHRYLWGDLQFEPAGQIPRFRPMGQDLVVMRHK